MRNHFFGKSRRFFPRRVGLSLCLLLLVVGAAFGGSAQGPWEMAPLNPAFVTFQQEVQVLGVTAATAMRGGLIPGPVDLSHLKQAQYPGLKGKAAPAAYDLRTLGRVTTVKNQDPFGTCWTFAALGSLESGLMPGENLDLSEWHLAYYAYTGDQAFTTRPPAFGPDPIFDIGCTDFMAVAMLAGWVGPVAESACPYGKPDPSGPSNNYPNVKHLTDALFPGDSSNRDLIKAMVQQYGGISMGYFSSGDPLYYNSATHSYYYNGTNGSNHAVLLVGWDDSYPAGNFASAPQGNGAWLVKNSWGTAWGDQGYFWLSYYDTSFEIGAIYRGGSATDYSRVYQYDPLGWVQAWGQGTNGSMANVFTAQGNDAITAVGFHTTDANVSYEISVYVDAASGPTSGTLASGPQTGTQAYAGFHTVRLNSPVSVTAGQKFSVVVKLINPAFAYPVACERAVANYSEKARANPGESFVVKDGVWTDLTTVDPTANVCLKVYAGSGAGPTRVPSGGGGGGCSGLGFAPLAVLVLVPLLALKRR